MIQIISSMNIRRIKWVHIYTHSDFVIRCTWVIIPITIMVTIIWPIIFPIY